MGANMDRARAIGEDFAESEASTEAKNNPRLRKFCVTETMSYIVDATDEEDACRIMEEADSDEANRYFAQCDERVACEIDADDEPDPEDEDDDDPFGANAEHYGPG